VAALDGTDIVYVVRSPSHRSISLTLSLGSRLPAFATSMGRVLLAGLDEPRLESFLATDGFPKLTPKTVTDPDELRSVIAGVREKGYAVVDEEREEGVRSAAVPIHGANGGTVGALNVSVNSARVTLSRLVKEFVPELLDTAQLIDDEVAALLPTP
jgi:IclR family transcriptional regulator, pca regulon regulatory protein